MNAKELIEEIQSEKKAAVGKGTLREEKALDLIKKNEIPKSLPEGWEWCRLGDYAMKVTDYVASGSFASLKENVLITNEENYAVMVKTADFANGFTKNLTFTDEHGYKFLENSNLFGGELILSNIGSIGKVFIVPDLNRPMTLASNTVMVRMTHKEYNKYLYYMFKSSFGQNLLMSIASGTSMLKFNKTQLKSAVIPIAPLEEQEKICTVLDRVQNLIDKRKQELEKLEDLVKARFVEMFGNPVQNPFGWEKKRFDEICENLDSRRKPITSSDRVEGIYPYYGASGIVDYVEDYIFDEDILLVSEDGANLLMRSTPIAFSVSGKVWVNNHAHVVRFKKMCLQKYIEILFSLIDISDSITGSAQPKLNQAKLNAMEFPIPYEDRLEEYFSFLEQVDKSKVAVQKSLEETQLLFDSLMQEYFG